MNKFIVCVLILTITAISKITTANAEDPETYAVQLVREGFGGDLFEAKVLEDYPGAQFNWEADLFEMNENGDFVYIVVSELKRPNAENMYHFHEVKISSINRNSELAKKYGLEE